MGIRFDRQRLRPRPGTFERRVLDEFASGSAFAGFGWRWSFVFLMPGHISCRIAQRSWKIGLNSDSFRNGTPGDPPVPFFAPIVRSTSLMCR